MKKTAKILCSIALCCTLMLSALPLTGNISFLTPEAAAAEEGYYSYEIEDEKAEITDVNSAISGNITIPSTLGGYPVTSIGFYAFYGCTGLTSVTIPDSVTRIRYEAFYGCTGLTSVTIPDSVTSIGESAFSRCTGLTSITIPDSVTSIGESAFSGCIGFTSVTIPDSVTSIGSFAFSGCTGLTSVTIPDSVTYIEGYAFADCTRLTAITIPDSVTSIEYCAFSGCSGLTSVTIPDSVTSIGRYAFSGCTGLTSVTIPDSVTSIGSSAFYGCTGLTSVTIPDSVTSIENYTFKDCVSLKSVKIPNSVTEIAYGVFYNCTSLADIKLPDNVTSISSHAFHNTGYYNDNENWEDGVLYLSKVLYDANTDISGIYTVKDGTTSIGSYAFDDNKLLTGIEIPDSVTTIGSYTFRACTALSSITFPESVTTIGVCAFDSCTALTSITFSEGVTDIGNYAFRDCTALESITFPDSVVNIGYDVIYNTAYYNNDANWENGVLYVGNHIIEVNGVKGAYEIKPGTKTVASFSYNEELTSVSVPDSVTSLQYYEFIGCTSLEKIDLPDTLIDIYADAFHGTAFFSNDENYENNILYLEKYLIAGKPSEHVWNEEIGDLEKIPGVSGDVIVKDGTKYIVNNAFQYCFDVETLKLPDSLEYIGMSAFAGCNDLTEVVLPENVSFVGHSAFCGTSLQKITILNPRAELDDFTEGRTPNDKAVIHGYTNSTADIYAKEHGLEFVSIGIYDVKDNINNTETIKTVGESSIFALVGNTVQGLSDNISGNFVIKDKDGKDVSSKDILKSGMTVTFIDAAGKTVKAFTVIVPCDNDGDGAVSSSDARTALRAAVGLDKLSDWQIAASDVEGSVLEGISSADARYILRAAVGLESVKDWMKNI
ncbi:MAG: leucine-rich repeat protein [Clostridia bacterium]|nr:leucine-rich repeat protein [Clostridia bacterium]